MKKLIRISEECHGTIAVASNFEKAIQYLLDEGWISEHTCLYDESREGDATLFEIFGENWQTELFKQDGSFFDGLFYFYEIDFVD